MEQQDILSSSIQKPSNLPALPHATASLVLGILSLIFCFIYGLPGLILGVIGLVLANKDRSLYKLNPEMYSTTSYANSNAGRVCSLIGVILSALFLICIIIGIAFLGVMTKNFTDFDLLRQ
jgi:hypothetical protein